MQQIERFAPAAAGLAAFVGALLCPDEMRGWVEKAFGPVFDLATFSAGMLFTIYVLALSRNDGFLGRIFNTETFRRFHLYVSGAILLNVILFLWTAFYMVTGTASSLDQSAWAGLVVWAFVSVARVVFCFLAIVGSKGSRSSGKPAGQAS